MTKELEAALRAILGPECMQAWQAKVKVYTDPDGLHCHTCPSCQTVWQHPTPPASLSDACEGRWHECPCCHTEQRVKTKLADVTHIDYPWEGRDNG